jgi:Na+/H+-dicarboxylate symporter
MLALALGLIAGEIMKPGHGFNIAPKLAGDSGRRMRGLSWATGVKFRNTL